MTKNSSATLDHFLRSIDDPDEWRTVLDVISGERVKLSHEDLLMIKQIHDRKFAALDYDPFAPWQDFFTYKTAQEPLPIVRRREPTPKSKEKLVLKKIEKIQKAISKRKALQDQNGNGKKTKSIYDIWINEDENKMGIKDYISAPKVHLPDIRESYNPPSEYLFNDEELEKWNSLPSEKKLISPHPTRYSFFRHIPLYEGFIRERFNRCLDLYLCPRTMKLEMMNMNPDSLLPVLPDPADLRPFPTSPSITFKHGDSLITALSVDPTGQWLLSGDNKGMVKMWEISTGKSLREWNFVESVGDLSWNPAFPSLFACSFGVKLQLVVVKDIINGWENVMDRFSSFVYEPSNFSIKQISWHGKGDYLAIMTVGDTSRRAVSFHQISKGQSQNPFTRIPGDVRSIIFHPSKPEFYLATQRAIRHYDLVKKSIIRKISINNLRSMALNPIDHGQLLVGLDDGQLRWYDTDYSLKKPYKTLNLELPIRSCAFHSNYPLFMGHTNQMIQVSHGKVWPDDLEKFPQIVPLKRISLLSSSNSDSNNKDNNSNKNENNDDTNTEEKRVETQVVPSLQQQQGHHHISKVIFHPKEPWLLVGKGNGEIVLYA